MSEYKEALRKFKEVRSEVMNLISQYPPELREKVIFDKWSLKDVIAHLSTWMVHDIDCLQDLIKGKEPYWHASIDKLNDIGVNERRDRTWDNVYEEFQGLIQKLERIYTNLPEHLQEKKIWKDKDLTPLVFIKDDIAHWSQEHLPVIRQKLKDNL